MRKQEIGEKSMNLIEKVFGTHSERELKLIRPIVDKILGMREQMVACATIRASSKSALQTARRWTTFCRRHLQPCVRRRDGY